MLDDTRDSYITKKYLGILRSILISNEGISISLNIDPKIKIQALKEKILEDFTKLINHKIILIWIW